MNDVKLQQELNEIKRLLKQNFINEKDVLTSKEILSYLNTSYSILTKLTSNSLIPYYKPTNGLLFFFKSDYMIGLKTIKFIMRVMLRNF